MKSKRAFMLFVTVLWIIAGITLIITLNQEDEEAVVETFGQINCEKLQSRFYSEGTLEENYLTRNEQTQLLENMAKQIGITKNYEISQQDNDNKHIIMLDKSSDSAQVVMKIITYEVEVEDNVVQTKQYFSMELCLYKYVEEIVVLKQEVEKVLADSPFKCDSGLEFEAEFNGELSLSEKKKLSQWYLKEINAKTVSDRKDSDIYTIYAYTKYISDYQIVDGNAVNVNLIFNYDEEKKITHFYMATPYFQREY